MIKITHHYGQKIARTIHARFKLFEMRTRGENKPGRLT